MATLPILHKRRPTRRERALYIARGTARAIVSMKLAGIAARAAMGSAKMASKAKGAKVTRRPLVAVVAVPAAVGGGVLAWRKLAGHHDHNGSTASAHGSSSVGPVASPAAVSPATSAPTFADETT